MLGFDLSVKGLDLGTQDLGPQSLGILCDFLSHSSINCTRPLHTTTVIAVRMPNVCLLHSQIKIAGLHWSIIVEIN